MTGQIVDFPFVNGNIGRDAGRGSGFYKLDASLKKTFRIPRTEHMSLELRADAFNVLNHSNWQGFNGGDATSALALSLTGTGAPASDFFTCTSCMRPSGIFVGNGGQLMHLSDLQHGKLSPNLLKPIFGGIGDPTAVDIARTFQLSLHFRF